MRKVLVRTLLAGLGLGTFGMGGCYSTYVADVRNKTPQPVYAELVRNGGAGNTVILAKERIPPGDRMGLTVRVPDEWPIFLQVDTPGNTAGMPQFNLTPGTQIVEVTQDGPNQTGKVRIDPLPR